MIDIKIRSSVVCIVILVGLLWLLTLTSTSYTQEQVETPQVVQDVEWHPRGEGLLVTGRGRQGVWGLWLYDTNLQLVRFFQFENPVSADWSPDGQHFSVGRQIINTQTLEVSIVVEAASGIGGWSQDGKEVLAWADEAQTTLGLFSATTGKLVRTIPSETQSPERVSWSPNNTYFMIVEDPSGKTNIIRASDGVVIFTLPIEGPIATRWSPDSRYLAFSYITTVSADTPGAVLTAPNPWLGSVTVWDIQNNVRIFHHDGFPDVPQTIHWHPYQYELMVGDGATTTVWDIASGEPVDTLFPTPGFLGLTYTPYGGRIILGGGNVSPRIAAHVEEARNQFFGDAKRTLSTALNGAMAIIVPAPSLDRLNAIAELCVHDAPTRTRAVTGLASQRVNSLDTLPNFVAQVESLPEGAIPAACRADLLAVAEALR